MLSTTVRCLSILLVTSWTLAAPEGAWSETLAVTGATIIDGTGKPAVSDGVVVIADGRIKAVGRAQDVAIPKGAKKVDARGKYAIPGIMDGVNLAWFIANAENLVRYEGRYHEILIEGAQVALKSGITGTFVAWRSHGPARKARDMIRSGEVPGASMYFGGNIIGFDGVFSPDAYGDPGGHVNKAFAKRVNEEWEQGTGRKLMWMSPEEVRAAIRKYIQEQHVDYIKYAACGHGMQGGYPNTQFSGFSPRVQKVIVEEGHRAGLTVQAHTMTVESAEMALDAGVDILTHGDVSGPNALPEETLRKIVERGVAVGVLPITRRNLEARLQSAKGESVLNFEVSKTNRRNMIKAGVTMLLGSETWIRSADELAEPTPADLIEPSLHSKLGEGHINALVALEEEGMDRMTILKTATSNVARAYKLDAQVGTLEPGKIANLVILDANPLDSARNYGTVRTVIKDGKLVDRNALPLHPLITRPAQADAHADH